MDNLHDNNYDKLKSMFGVEEVRSIVKISHDLYLCWFTDYSACVTNSKGEQIKAPVNDFDFILDFKTLDKVNDKEHYVFEATDWATRHNKVFAICNIDGEIKFIHEIFNNAKYGIENLLNDKKNEIAKALNNRSEKNLTENEKENTRRLHI